MAYLNSHVLGRSSRTTLNYLTNKVFTQRICSPTVNGAVILNNHQQRDMSNQPGFFKKIVDNIKTDMTKSKEMKNHLKKFRDEAEKLEQTDALKKARLKYQNIEAETSKGSQSAIDTMNKMQEKFKETLSEAEKTEFGKKGKEFAKSASEAAKKIGETTDQISQSGVYKSVSKGIQSVKSEIDETALHRAKLYQPPTVLRKRVDTMEMDPERFVKPDTESIGMVMHKDSKWTKNWQEFKENNQFVTKMFDMKTKYDESDHVILRASKSITEKVTDIFGTVFAKTEMSEVLTEIVKADPTFDKEKFIEDIHNEIIPNVLEAMVRGELEILKDWCYEAAYNQLATPIKQMKEAKYTMHSRVLDINNIELVAGKIMDQGPVLVVSFSAQQVMQVVNSKGETVEGDPDKIMKIFYVWAFCRDQSILDPRAAWRVIDMSSQPTEQWV